jgi:hypothetical protein
MPSLGNSSFRDQHFVNSHANEFRWSGVLSYGHPECTARMCRVPPANPCRTMQCRENQRRQTTMTEERIVYLSFFLGRSWLVWPHLRLRQLVARGGRRA